VIDSSWRLVAEGADEAELDYVDDGTASMTIEADYDRVSQLFEHLFGNAIKHSGVDATVTIGKLEGRLYVEDDGPGIPEDDRDRVFDAGYSTAQEETDYGLSIVKKAADADGWDICVTEVTEGGGRFEIQAVEFVE